MLSAKRGESGVRRATRVCGDGRELTRRAAGRVKHSARSHGQGAAPDGGQRLCPARAPAVPASFSVSRRARGPGDPRSLGRPASGRRRPLGLAASHVHVPRAGVLGGDVPLWKRHELSPGWSPIRAGGREASASVSAAEKGKLQDGLRMVAAMKADDRGRL